MNNNLLTTAYFNEENLKDSDKFYLDCFLKLKKEFNFSYCAFFYKTQGKYILSHKHFFDEEFSNYTPEINKKDSFNKLKIPIKMQNSTIGYFLFVKKEIFIKQEKEKAKKACLEISYIIKDFEISKIFQNQLSILQNAILEKNLATKKLEEQNEKLIETDKIRSEFLANVSHELRTPLNSIIGFSTALKDEMLGGLNEKQKNYTNKILTSAIHLTGLINDILDMTKIEAKGMKLNLGNYFPSDIIKEAINIIEPLANEKNIKIEFFDDYKSEFLIDYQKFKQVIYNLLGNAIKFSYENSKVIIKIYKKEKNLFIKIQDFGIGIDKKNHNKIFEKFVQLDNIYTKKYSSTGLGLTITKEFVKMLGGEISLKSELNKGTIFILKFKI